MPRLFYPQFRTEEPILRDFLAVDRTILSNERTLLAYVRTALALVIVGGSAVKFFDSMIVIVTGWIFLCGAAITLFFGLRSFRATQVRIRNALSLGPAEVEEAAPDA